MADKDDTDTDLEIEKTYETNCQSLFPRKSKGRYGKLHESYKKWLCAKKVVITEKTFVAYFIQGSL